MRLYVIMSAMMLTGPALAKDDDILSDAMGDHAVAFAARDMCHSEISIAQVQETLKRQNISPKKLCQCTIVATVHHLQGTVEAVAFAAYKQRAARTGTDSFRDDHDRKAQEMVQKAYQESNGECLAWLAEQGSDER